MDASMSASQRVRINLTDAQVIHVVRMATGFAGLLPASDLEQMRSVVLPLWDDERLSRSTLSALLVLAAFPADGGQRMITAVANELGFSTSATQRYVRTLLAVGLLECDPITRRYRRAPATRGVDAR
jgi:hypothetical protein